MTRFSKGLRLVSIVVPTLNEGNNIKGLLRSLAALPGKKEIIVADGGSTDDTLAQARGEAHVIGCPKGRGAQMNAGANRARGDVLWFVHSDSMVAPSSLMDINRTLDAGRLGGFFRLEFHDANDGFMNFVARSSHARARRWGLVFGDQALFVRRGFFTSMGGFAPLALMEDWEFSRRLRPFHRRGLIEGLETPVWTSARRFSRNGYTKTMLTNHMIKGLYMLGVSTETLATIYRGRREN